MEKSLALIKICHQSIIDDNADKLAKDISIFPIDKIPKEQSDSLLASFLTTGANNNRVSLVKIIFDSWKRVHPLEERISLFTSMFYQLLFPVEILVYCAYGLPEYTYEEIAVEIVVKADPGPLTSLAMARLDKVFGQQFLILYKQLFDLSKGTNSYAENYLSYKIRELNDYAPFPKWVKTFITPTRTGEATYNLASGKGRRLRDDDILPENDQFVLPESESMEEIILPPIDEIVTEIMDNMTNIPIDKLEETKNLIKAKIGELSQEEIIEMIKHIRDIQGGLALQYNVILFRLLGPANPPPFAQLEELEYGGERMFTDLTWEYDEDDDMAKDDWFTGACMFCNLKLRRRWHAVRIPKLAGGWQGCFCNWKCVSDCLRERFSEGDVIQPEPAVEILINTYSGQLNKLGIQDRQ